MTEQVEAYVARSDEAAESGDMAAAIAHLRAGIAAWPDRPECHSKLVDFLLKIGKPNDAAEALAAAGERFNKRDSFTWLRVKIEMARGHLDVASQISLKRAAKKPGDYRRAKRVLALYLAMGDAEGARALAYDPKGPAGVNPKIRLLYEKACPTDLQRVLDEIEDQLRNAPEDRELLGLQMLFYLLQGRIAASWEAWLKSIAGLTREERQKRIKSVIPRIVSESRIDAYACSEMEIAAHAPHAERVARLGRLVCEEPDHVGAALALLNALREGGASCTPVSILRGSSGIPLHVAQYWPKPDMPPEIAPLVASWPAMNPDLPCELYTEEMAEAFIRRTCGARTLDAFHLAKTSNLREALFRCAYLAMRGGIYVSARVPCRREGVRALVEGPQTVLLVQDHLGAFRDDFIAAAPGDPFILKVLSATVDRILSRERDRPWMMYGGGALMTHFCSTYAASLGQGRIPEGIRIVQTHEAAPYMTLPHALGELPRFGVNMPDPDSGRGHVTVLRPVVRSGESTPLPFARDVPPSPPPA